MCGCTVLQWGVRFIKLSAYRWSRKRLRAADALSFGASQLPPLLGLYGEAAAVSSLLPRWA